MSYRLEHTDYGYSTDKGKIKAYCSVPSIKLPSGKTWRPSGYGKTKKEARKKLELVLRRKEIELEQAENAKKIEREEAEKARNSGQNEANISNDISNTLVEQLRAYAVLKQEGKVKAVKKKLKKGSINDKRELIRNLVEPYSIGKKNVSEIKRKDIIKWIEALQKDGHSEKRQKGAYNLLTDYYDHYYCYEIDPDFTSPATGFRFEIKKSKADPLKVLDDDEIRMYLAQCEKMGHKADILQFMLYTYCREGEAATLTWADWNQKDLIHIHNTWSKDENGKRIVDSKPKTPDSDRYIRLPEQAIQILTCIYADVEMTEGGEPNAWIFPSLKDKTKPFSVSTIRNNHEKILKELKLNPSLRVHDLRHSGISFNIRNSQIDCISALSKQAGHSSRSITEDIYEHVLDFQKVELAQISTKIYDAVCPWS